MFNDFNVRRSDRTHAHRTRLSVHRLAALRVSKDADAIRFVKLLTPSDSVNFGVKKLLTGKSNFLSVFCLKRMSLDVRILSDAQDVAFAIVDDRSDVLFSHLNL